MGDRPASLLVRRPAGEAPARLVRLPETPGSPADAQPEDYRQAFERAYETLGRAARKLQATRSAAPRLYRELLGRPAEQRRLLIRNGRRFANWGLAELLLGEAQRCWAEDPASAEEAARLACEILARPAAERELRPFQQDLGARAESLVAHAHLLRGELSDAAEALAGARAHLRQGSGDPLEEAHLLEVEARLERARRCPQAAVLALRQAVVAYRRAGERVAAARALLLAASVVRELGETQGAIRLLHRARTLVPDGQEPRVLLSVLRALVPLLGETGRTREAAAALTEARKLALKLGGPARRVRLPEEGARVLAFSWLTGDPVSS